MDMSELTLSATKPAGKPAKMLAGMGINVLPVEEDEGNVDRYIASKRLAIERRTASGFLRGIMEKTLFTSAICLREHFAIPVLVVEGQVDFTYTRFDPQAIRGALSAMMLEYGVNVVSTPNMEETVHLIAMMARQEQVGIPEISLIPKRKAGDLADMQRRVVEMLPGCGMVMARDLLQRFGSVERVVEATRGELLSQRGIGAKKADEILRVLHAEYESVDTERDLENAIEADPKLLFKHAVTLVDRQHYIYTDQEERQFVDLVFLDRRRGGELILVELKRGKLARAHHRQIRGYLDHAVESPLLRKHLDAGARLRGMLATVEPCEFDPRDDDVTVRIVDRKRVIRVLKRLRQKRLASGR